MVGVEINMSWSMAILTCKGQNKQEQGQREKERLKKSMVANSSAGLLIRLGEDAGTTVMLLRRMA